LKHKNTCNAGKNKDSIKAGLLNPIRGATSRVILKYGSWICYKKYYYQE